MAKAQARGKRHSSAKLGKKGATAGDEARALAAALDRIAENGWRKLTIADVARKAGLPPARVRALFPGREAVLETFFLDIDRRVAAEGGYAADDPSPARDRLFDVLMRRFDALAPHRPAMKALIKDLPLDPETAAWCAYRLSRSLAWTLDTAGLSARGALGRIRVKGLVLIYLNALRAWLSDETADMSPTMAALDKGLRAAESILGALAGILAAKAAAAAAAAKDKRGRAD